MFVKWIYVAISMLLMACSENDPVMHKQPNFLIVISDDQSWIHTSFAGHPIVKTPNFDQIAKQGVYFQQAYASAPTCTASRSALFSGQHFWQTGPGSVLHGDYPEELPNFQLILQEHNYYVGYTGKGWGPGLNHSRLQNPAGKNFSKLKHETPKHISDIDYVANFKHFLNTKSENKPFSFVFAAYEPHRRYDYGIGKRNGINLEAISVPDFLPDTPVIRNDLADYFYEINWYDEQLGLMIEVLKQRHEWENTVIIITSDNGMPFPRAKSNNYDYGVRVPLAIYTPYDKPNHATHAEPVSLTDIAPTVLDLANIPVPTTMSGHSLKQTLSDPRRKTNRVVFSGFNRHRSTARENGEGYPVRAAHTSDYIYIRNWTPERWPAGNPPQPEDIDSSPTKRVLIKQDISDKNSHFYLAAGKRPEEELYFLSQDPFQLNNLAHDNNHIDQRQALKNSLINEMKLTKDPLLNGDRYISEYISNRLKKTTH